MFKNVATWQYVQVWSNNTWVVLIMNLKNQHCFFFKKKIIYDASQICMHVILSMILGSILM
jgi:hypothetical protein